MASTAGGYAAPIQLPEPGRVWITRPNSTGKTTDALRFTPRRNAKGLTMPTYYLHSANGRRFLRDDASPLTLDLGDGPTRWAVLPMPSLVTAAALVVTA